MLGLESPFSPSDKADLIRGSSDFPDGRREHHGDLFVW